MNKLIAFILASILLVSCNPDAIIPTGTGNGITVTISEINSVTLNSANVNVTFDYPANRALYSVGIKEFFQNPFPYPNLKPLINSNRITGSVSATITGLAPNQEYKLTPYAIVSVDGQPNNKNERMTFLGSEKSIQTKRFFIENGIFKCPDGTPGTTVIINNKKIEVVDRALLIKRRDEKEDMSCLCTTNVTDMTELFADNYPDFNQDISSWDLSNVTSTRDMFRKAFNFNQPIGNWDVSKVTDMAGMFFFAEKFNQNLGNWNVSNVKKMHYMFREAKIFNGDISRWNVSNVDNFYSMFLNAWQFNQPIGNWNTKSGIDLGDMFWGARSFNQPIGNWDLGNAKNLAGMFNGASIFNQDLSKWNVSKVERMDYMFHYALNFNQPIGMWNVRKVTTMDFMFTQAEKFNQNLNSWCVPLIKSQPIYFSPQSPLTTKNKPFWGGCFSEFLTVISKTGRVWMDRNLGALQTATSISDEKSFGDLYQWGRSTDGHQSRLSNITSILSSVDYPGTNNYIISPNPPYDWRKDQNPNLWQGVEGTNNPCPKGYRLPTESEWNQEIATWNKKNATGAYESSLKLPSAGIRFENGSILVNFVEPSGFYWSSTVSNTYSRLLDYYNRNSGSNAYMYSNQRAYGASVRCIQD